jgi:hypothetical protein
MSFIAIYSKNVTLALTITAVGLTAFSASTEARERKERDNNRTATWSGKSGNHTFEGSGSQKIHREGGKVTRDTNWQNSRGTGSSQYNREYNRDDKSFRSDRETTNAQGKTATSNRLGQKTDTGYQVEGSRTGYNGNTSTMTSDYTKTETGYDVNRNITTNSGKTIITNGSVTKTDEGYSKTGTYNTSGGNSGTYYKDSVRSEDGRTINSSIVNQDGKTMTKNVIGQHGDGQFSRDSTITRPNGTTSGRTINGTYSRGTNP